MKKILAISLIAVAVVSCGDREAENANRCQSYGIKPDTPQYGECMTQMHIADQQGNSNMMNAVIMSQILSNMNSNNGGGYNSGNTRNTTIVNHNYTTPTPTAPAASATKPAATSPVAPKPSTTFAPVAKPVVKTYTAPAQTYKSSTSSIPMRSISKSK